MTRSIFKLKIANIMTARPVGKILFGMAGLFLVAIGLIAVTGCGGASTGNAKTNPGGNVPGSPTASKIYVGNFISSNVTVIDGATNATATVLVGANPLAIAANPTTNKIYIVNGVGKTVSVIDGATGSITATVPVGKSPEAIGINPTTNRIYVANTGDNTVTVIDGADNFTTTINVGTFPTSRSDRR